MVGNETRKCVINSDTPHTLRTADPALHHPASTGTAQAATAHGIRDALRACDPHLIATPGRLPRTRSDRLCSAIGSPALRAPLMPPGATGQGLGGTYAHPSMR
jgi:hypothetical protein